MKLRTILTVALLAVACDVSSSSTDAGDDPNTCEIGKIVRSAKGRVVTELDQPPIDAHAQLCLRLAPLGTLVCLRPVEVDATGGFDIAIPEEAKCLEQMVLRVLVPASEYATVFCLKALPEEGTTLEIPEPFILYQTRPPLVLPELGDPSTPRTVVFEDGLEMAVTPNQFFSVSQRGYADLTSRRLPPDSPGLCFLEEGQQLEAIYAFSPEGNVRDGGFAMRIPNSTDLSPGTRVSLHALGGLVCTTPDGGEVEEGHWMRYGSGTVNPAGDFIEGPETVLPCTSFIGYARE